MITPSEIRDSIRVPSKEGKEIKGTWLGPGINPLMAEYMSSKNTQNAQPEYKGNALPVYVPMTAKDKIHGDKPVHNAELLTRSEYINAQLTEATKDSSSIAGVYKSYFMAWLCLGLMVATYMIHPYIAAVFAYLAGYYWAWKQIAIGWGREWFKGKMLTHTT